MPSTQRSALGRLLQGLKRQQHDYQASLELFPALNIDKLADDMGLATLGGDRGAREEPASDSVVLDEVENRIVERIETEKNAAHGLLLDQLRTYQERLSGLDFEGRFGTIRQAAPAAVTEFRAEAAQGRDELHSLRRHLRDLEMEHDEFRRRHRLKRAAHWASGGNLTLKIGILLALFVFEVFLNGFFLSKGSELGYLGGAVEAFTFALLNVGVSFLIAAAGVRQLNHRNYLRKLFGLVCFLCYVVLAVGLNLALAHYREASGALVADAGREVLARLQANPLGIADLKSWLFFALGLLCSLIAFADAFLVFDPYPGYAPLEKRRAEAHDAYIRRKNDLIAQLLEIRDDAIEALEEANRDLSVRRGEHDAILESRARLVRLFAAHQSALDRAANALLSMYREANKRRRKTPAPSGFATAFSLEKFPVEQSLLETSARDDLRRSIAESQAMLAGQVQAVHAEFEKAFASYREIDELVEEKPVARTNAKAA
ncbi:MAG TPA: hypothetical protein VH678_31040 [Xanthobacteraceae bacterium]|jgi:hypothetical protein